jgi:hypothetical protein
MLREINATVNTITIVRLSGLLDLSPDEAADWLVAKVAQFRGISESDAKALIEDTNRAV